MSYGASYGDPDFLRDFGQDSEVCYQCGRVVRMGRCPCCDYGEGPRCAVCSAGPVVRPVCACGKLVLRATDAKCPACDPAVFTVFGRTA